MRYPSFVEPLESRISPATFTFTDIDGDVVTIRTNRGTDAELAGILVFSDPDPATARQLFEIDFSLGGAVFEGTSLSVTAKRSATGGDGRVNVGYIDASSTNGEQIGAPEGVKLNLGRVLIDGDLGQIDCGNATSVALQSLDVVSMGRFELTTQSAVNGSQISLIDGRIGALKVRTDLVATNIDSAQIGSITIGGSLIADLSFGHIKASGSIGPVRVGGDLRGGFADLTGTITTSGALIKSVFIGGSVLGGDGGSGSTTGAVVSAGDIGRVTVLGDLRGYEDAIDGGEHSGAISAGGNMGAVRIGGDLVGSSIRNIGSDNSVDFSGAVQAGGSIKSVAVGGSVMAGFDVSALGTLSVSGGIAAGKNIGRITIFGSVVGESVNLSLARILAGTADAPVAGKLAGIGKIVVKGDVEYAEIRAGVAVPGSMGAPNLDAQIGAVSVGRNWIASELTAGIAMVGSDNLALHSRIGPVKIGGQVLGDFTGGTSFTFSAEEVAGLRVGDTVIPLVVGKRNDLAAIPVGITGDVTVVEVP